MVLSRSLELPSLSAISGNYRHPVAVSSAPRPVGRIAGRGNQWGRLVVGRKPRKVRDGGSRFSGTGGRGNGVQEGAPSKRVVP